MRTIIMTTVVLLVLMSLNAWADKPGTDQGAVLTKYAYYSGTLIDSTNSVAIAAGGSDVNSDKIFIARTENHSVGITMTATQTVSCSVKIQGSWDAGTTWADFDSSVTVTHTANGSKIRPVSIPVIPYIRFVLSADATYPVTYTCVNLNCW